MNSMKRSWAPAVAALAALFVLSGCADDLDEAAVAAAKCANAVHGELKLPDSDTGLNTDEVRVDGSASERTVTGLWSHALRGEGNYKCVVVPDDSDELRGLRVTSLDVEVLSEASATQSPSS